MEAIGVFLKYCKIRHIIPELKMIEKNQAVCKYVYDAELNSGNVIKLDFKNFVNKYVGTYGFYYLFEEIENCFLRKYSDIMNYRHQNPKYTDALKRWKKFVKKNIEINGIKPGDIITTTTDFNGELVSFTEDKTFFLLSDLNDKNRIIRKPISSIKKVNGKEAEISYYIKWKGKEYGNN